MKIQLLSKGSVFVSNGMRYEVTASGKAHNLGETIARAEDGRYFGFSDQCCAEKVEKKKFAITDAQRKAWRAANPNYGKTA